LAGAPPILFNRQQLIGQLAMIGSWRNPGSAPAKCSET